MGQSITRKYCETNAWNSAATYMLFQRAHPLKGPRSNGTQSTQADLQSDRMIESEISKIPSTALLRRIALTGRRTHAPLAKQSCAHSPPQSMREQDPPKLLPPRTYKKIRRG